jgi:hypothetical protein
VSEFTEALHRALEGRAVTPAEAIAVANNFDEDEREPTRGLVFDQYDGSSVGFYVELENTEDVTEATARLKDLVSELEPIQIELGTINGRPVFGRVTFHPSGVRPTYFKRHRYF